MMEVKVLKLGSSFILQTVKSLSQVFRKKKSLRKSKIISGFNKFPFFQNFLRIP